MTTLPPPRGLLIDAMGTLLEPAAPVAVTYARKAADVGVTVSPEHIGPAFDAAYRAAPPMAFPDRSVKSLDQQEKEWWLACVADTFQRAAQPLETTVLRKLTRQLFYHYASPEAWVVPEDVPRCLRRWHDTGLKLAVVSNFDSRLDSLLETLWLRHWFAAVLISSRCGVAKPNPRLFHLALERLGLLPHEAWHLGDTTADLQGARAAGIRCILVQRPKPFPSTTATGMMEG
ncbi:MAG: hypothetical protein TQ37_06440 [Candidatus Synechococcus spongiarum 15L]|uniref:Haloacid dehalogenase n=1 Tax=Candidatus Synechococcus spongiarum 15L TaxID=1608419 RepID=A0A0G8AUY9_9SYNE|nr:MAG: hypothetical protein TQ37_06440 [Candidatus Synechococcus spongiarum 15L]